MMGAMNKVNLAEKLALRLNVDTAPLPRPLGLNDVVCSYLTSHGRREEAYTRLRTIMREAERSACSSRSKLTGCKASSEVSTGELGGVGSLWIRRGGETTAGQTGGRRISPRCSNFRKATRQLTSLSCPKAVRQFNHEQTCRDRARRDKLGSASTVC